jgi:hypothetical protein
MRLNLFRTIACAILSSLATVLFANDGGFYISGNHLVPISNTTVKVAKEKLTIQLNDNNQTYVDVDYVFVNSSSKAQTIKMGFEAKIEDSWAHVPEKANTGHPNLHDFKIEMNGKPVNFSNEYAFVLTNEKDSTKYLDYSHFPVDKSKWVLGGKDYHEIAEGAWDNGLQNKETKELAPYAHVYYFEATFQPGENHIHHTYKYDEGGGQFDAFTVAYWLTPAARWAGGKIDDFTLCISVPETAKHFFLQGPFAGGNYNVTKGFGKFRNTPNGEEIAIRNGAIEWSCKNFSPTSDLKILAVDNIYYKENKAMKIGEFYDRNDVWISEEYAYKHKTNGNIETPEFLTPSEQRLLRNLPYAHRGYVFKDAKLNEYFSQFFWYMPDSTWKASAEDFTENEVKMVEWAKKALIKL